MVEVTVKYGLITMYRGTLDLCDHAEEVDMECPVARGKLVLSKAIDIPKQIPPVSIKPSVLKSRLWENFLLPSHGKQYFIILVSF